MREGYNLAQSQRLLDEVVPDESRLKPDDDGGQDNHRAIIERAFLIPGGYTAPLFKPVDAAFHHVASRIDRLVKDEWTTRSRRASRSLVASLWDRMLDLPLAQPAATPWIAVAFVSDEAIRAGPWSSASAGAWNPDTLTGSSWVLSWRCPGLITTESGRPRPSQARWNLVVSPPRLRPSASSEG